MKNRLSELMHQAKMSFRTLSIESGLNTTTLFRIASGHKDPRLSTLLTLCDTLSRKLKAEVSIYDVFPRSGRQRLRAQRRAAHPGGGDESAPDSDPDREPDTAGAGGEAGV